MMVKCERTSFYQYTQHSASEEERLEKLKRILNFLATRIPVVPLKRVEEDYPDLNLNVRTHNSGRSCTLLSKAAYGNRGYKCAMKRCGFNIHKKSEPENSDKECRVFDKCQNIKNDLAEYGSDKCDSKGSEFINYSSDLRYPCKFCKKWLRGSYIKLHTMKHMGTLPHVCKICANQFAFSSNLKAHYRRIHGLE